MAVMEALGTSEIALVAAFFIGLMMALSPCPLITNITAMAYISRNIGAKKSKVLLIGIAYTLGRALAYVSIASFIVFIGLNAQSISFPLQIYWEKMLGPFLILMGAVLLGIFKTQLFKGSKQLESIKEKLANEGLFGSFLLGVIFALAFCPFSAVLFFGMLIPLAIESGDGFAIPLVFAIATGLPVVLFSLVLAYSLSKLGSILHNVQTFEKYARTAAAVIFILAGLYCTISITLGLI